MGRMAAPGLDVVDLLAPTDGNGVVWSTSPEGFHANLVSLEPGAAIDAHRNDEVDVLVIVVAGGGRIDVDGTPTEVRGGTAVVIPKGTVRRIEASAATGGGAGLRYLTVHARRGPMSIGGPRR
jgi:quercetin dioxygenase-like cupin family protein